MNATRRTRLLVYIESLALLIVVVAALLGAHEFIGTFAGTGEVMSCGSVWGLPRPGNLNGASCQSDLRDRVTVVALLLGLAAAIALIAPLTLHWSAMKHSPRRWLGALLAFGIPIALSVAIIVAGRHLIWSISSD